MYVNLVVGISGDLRNRVFVLAGHMPSSRWQLEVDTCRLDESERLHLLRMARSSRDWFPLRQITQGLDDGDDVYVSTYAMACSRSTPIVADMLCLPVESDDESDQVAIDAYLRSWCAGSDGGPTVDDAVRALIRGDAQRYAAIYERARRMVVDHARASLDSMSDHLLAAFIREALDCF